MKHNFLSFFFLVLSATAIWAQRTVSDSVRIDIGKKSRIQITIGDPSDILAIRQYDVEGLINDLIDRLETSRSSAGLNEPFEYRVDSMARRTQLEVEMSLRELERELDRWSTDSARNRMTSEDVIRLRRLSRLQARMAAEKVRRQLRNELEAQRRALEVLKGSNTGSLWKSAEDAADAAAEAAEKAAEAAMESMASALKEAEQAMREVESEEEGMPEPSGLEETDDDREDQDDKKTRRRTYNSFGFDFGINNLLSDGEFIDAQNPAYAVRPLGSWYASFNSTNRTRIANKLFLEWGPGVSFYNFKFLNDDTRMTKSADGVDFVSDDREVDFIKSKLTAYYASFSLVPVIDFGGNRQKPGAFADRGSDAFRIGLGTYVSSRIDS